MNPEEKQSALDARQIEMKTVEEFLMNVCPNHTDSSKWNKSELIHILKLHADQFRKWEEINLNKVNRVEVIDHYGNTGRMFVLWKDDLVAKAEFQDNHRTFKIFLSKDHPTP